GDRQPLAAAARRAGGMRGPAGARASAGHRNARWRIGALHAGRGLPATISAVRRKRGRRRHLMTRPNDDARIATALVGAWRLVSWTIEYPASGRVTQPFGAVPEGLLMYSADGHMSAALQRPGRARLSRADPN